MNYIFFGEEFSTKIKDNQKRDFIYAKINNLKHVENLNNLNSIDSYNKGIYVLKFSKTNLSRVIIQKKELSINEKSISVLFVRDFISTKSFDYYWGNVIHPQLRNGEWIKENNLKEEEVESFKQEYLNRINNALVQRKPLPERLTKWLKNFQIKLKFDVFERENWVLFSNDNTPNGLRPKDIDKFKKTIKKLLYNGDDSGLNIKKVVGASNIYEIINEEDNIGIVISDFSNINQNRVILLHDGAHLGVQKDRWKEAINRAQKSENDIEANLEAISKDAFRAYPKWILKQDDDEYWDAIQRHDGTHNLSLLPEQINFLNSFEFPTYINGQAGSGKSTMLYYLFANVISYKLSGELKGDIIFLTENDNLLEHTIQSVCGLLASNPEFDFGFSLDDKITVKKYFSSFKNYLLNILPEEERRYFTNERYLDFAKFKKRFNKQYSNIYKKISAEEAWFVISTYVYGYDENKKIDSVEKYIDISEGIPSKFRIIDELQFKEIIASTLPFYKNLISEGFWDKTTLVRKIREFFPDELPKQYSVVFCDEAQDFSRIELRLILKSSEYTNFNLSQSTQIPIVFAGDALQTVSPIGFSVRRLQQMYYNTFKEANFTYDKTKSTYTPEYNYRSVEPIVKLANVVQNYRKESLNEDFTLKQKAKRYSNQIPIFHTKEWLLLNENRILFNKKFKYKSFIVPVDLNEEKTFIDGEELLDSKIFPDIKSSIDAKGAEYSQVVVYGFGNEYVKEFGTLNWNTNKSDFKKKFFFNKLYVALTRAQNELVIIDNEKGCEEFWKPLLDIPETISDRWEIYSDYEDILLISPQTGLYDVAESTEDTALHNARIDKEQGIRDKNIARLIVATNIFLILGEDNEAYICQGYVEQIRNNWESAGDNFLKANDLEKAANSFFLGKIWPRLELDTHKLEGNKQEVRLLIASLMKKGDWTEPELNRIYELRNSLNEIIRNIEWYEKISEKLSLYATSLNSLGEKRDLAIILSNIVNDYDYHLLDTIANLYFEVKKFSLAIETWDKIYFEESNPSFSAKYVIAKIENAKEENNIQDELLWSGRLLDYYSEIDEGKIIKLSNRIYEMYTLQREIFDNSKVKAEMYSSLYRAIINLNEFSVLSEIGKVVESSYPNLEGIKKLYSDLIYTCKNEGVSIFLKERWVRLKLKELNFWDEVDKNLVLEKINKDFLEKGFPFSESNQPWTIEELSDINDSPEVISAKPNPHLKNIEIRNFRRFEKIELKNMGQFNLVLGDNNSGKTSLLEAFLFSPDPNISFLNFLYANQQRNNNAQKERKETFYDNMVFRDSNDKQIKFILKNGRRFWSYILRSPNNKELDSKEYDKRHFLTIESSSGESQTSEHIDIHLNSLQDPNILKNIPFIPFGKGYSEKIASVYLSEIGGERKLREKFNNQLKIFIPNIVGVVADTEQDIIEIEEEVNGNDYKYPLHNYGEGANKLFRILVQLHAAKNGRLNIDEIDAGIHHSHFKDFWKIILRTAFDYNVQLFVTTHNEECIKYFWEVLNEQAFEEYQEKSRIITLEKHVKTDEIIPIIRDYKSMKYAYDHHLEIRGSQ